VAVAHIEPQTQCVWTILIPAASVDIVSAVIAVEAAMTGNHASGIFDNRVLIAWCVIGANLGALAALAFGFPKRSYGDISDALRRWVFGMAVGIFATPLIFPYLSLPYSADLVMGVSGVVAGGSYFTVKNAAPVWGRFVKTFLTVWLESKTGVKNGRANVRGDQSESE